MARRGEKEEISAYGKSSSSSSSPSSEKEKSLYLRIRINSDKKSRYQWYVIDTSRLTYEAGVGESSDGLIRLRLISEMPSFFPSNSGCVAWESIIYVFGGQEKTSSPEVFYLDTCCPDAGWKKGPSMSVGRSEPYCAVIQGNIYVMGYRAFSRLGKSPDTSSRPWAEVLDPFLNEWKPLTMHPQLDSCVNSHVVFDGGKKILVHPSYSDSLFSYDVDGKSWNLIEETSFGSKLHDFQTPCAVVDDIMYYFSRKVQAYDLVKREWLSEPVRGLDGIGVSPPLYEENGYGSPERNFPKAFLVHLGNGKLCLLWEVSTYGEPIMHIHCTKFRISKHSDGGDETVLWAIIESLAVYTIDEADDILDCLVL